GDDSNHLVDDIEKAGGGLCYHPAVELLAKEGPKLVQRILVERLNVAFDNGNGGKPDLTTEGAHSIARILHSGDQTGRAIEQAFLNHLAKYPNLEIRTEETAIDLLTLAHHSLDPQDLYRPPRCFGAYVYHQRTKEVAAILAHETILATGGLG